jgi:hypothetical protein
MYVKPVQINVDYRYTDYVSLDSSQNGVDPWKIPTVEPEDYDL